MKFDSMIGGFVVVNHQMERFYENQAQVCL